MKLTVIGCGYLGATHAACMAELGHDVLGVDVDADKIARLAAGEVPFFEPGLSDLLRRNIDAGRLAFTTSYPAAAEHGSIHFIGVGTPQQARGLGADTTYVEAAVDTLVGHLRGDHLIIGKSTVPVGTAAALQARIDARTDDDTIVELAWSPEFLREGFAVEDTLRPDRLVVGTDPDAQCSAAVAVIDEIYREILETGVPFITTDWATAELVKTSANAFLATKISFINAISELCEIVGADVSTLADAIGHDNRIGRRFLNAGMGFGGGCLPKDIRAFMARADELGAHRTLGFLHEVDAINMRRRTAMVELVERVCRRELIGANIAILGAAFKPESDDVRDSPALSVAGQLALRGATVTVFDPKAADNARRMYPMLHFADSARAAVAAADVVAVTTEWAEFVHMGPDELDPLVRERVIVDGRRCLAPHIWAAAGWEYHALGGVNRSHSPARTTRVTSDDPHARARLKAI
ncbi:UDP-glucose/GDP-mannose dehydrogenase family protein [Gordonia sp. NB41Y]|uniref:UDP-glucose dehydrogenase family protein n=1 Tax=Gordonia sp. NB41Y TaxID=875808 RepID=UPI0002BFE190|nr:UDP-glucose/GDP-mannose dehydrogenase family protein [Gordonia sp. NB41Y]EMP15037.1 UDP-glucose 6-dehydrogenase [Gordonia sp. NB41Y]WLP89127.1 UDP-glucose/GDP-mannose dehydrogenase family protein [Gordonia sp. NB41Y]